MRQANLEASQGSTSVTLRAKPTSVLRCYPRTALVLCSMPWPPSYSPSLGITTLASSTKLLDPDRYVAQEHLYLDWFSEVLQLSMGVPNSGDVYRHVAERAAYTGIGDYLFSETVLPFAFEHHEEFAEIALTCGIDRSLFDAMHSAATPFVTRHAERLADYIPSGALVGASSTFTQTVPSLALLRMLKLNRPDISTLLGGSNLNPERARLLLESFDFLDSCVFGEGETTLTAMLRSMDGGQSPRPIDGAVVRDAEHRLLVGGRREPIDMSQYPVPDFGPYFERIVIAGLSADVEPALGYEISRGCWWGEKRHCTFCGLNGETMEYRGRRTRDVAEDILEMVAQYQVLDVLFADNILDPADIDRVFARLPEDIDLRMHLEVKADLSRTQLQVLRNHGVWHVQPGIESLSRRALALMRKGVTPMQNLRFLRNAEELGLTVSWNYLYGFPGELVSDHDEYLRQVHNLYHLQPASGAGLLSLVRYSPLFEDQSLGYKETRPARTMLHLYNRFTVDDVAIMSDVFEPLDGTDAFDDLGKCLRTSMDSWIAAHKSTFLTEIRCQRSVSVIKRESGEQNVVADITDESDLQIWEAARNGLSREQARRVAAELGVSNDRVKGFLEEATRDGIVYRDGGTYLTLPARYEDHIPYRLG